MSKIGIIISREYTTRVMKKSFLLLTFLTPLLFVAMIMIPLWLSNIQDDTVKNIIVIDNTGLYHDALKSNDTYTFVFSDKPLDNFRKKEKTGNELTAVLYITADLSTKPNAVSLYSEKQVNVELKSYISGLLEDFVQKQKLAGYNIPNLKEVVEKSKTNVDISTIKWNADGQEKEGSAELALIIGMISAFLIYIFIMSYGSQVMSGVLQEKTSRIVEVIISSVKPFELMMGKIIGIALVGLTQFFMWIALTLIITAGLSVFMGGGIDTEAIQSAQQINMPGMQSGMSQSDTQSMITEIYKSLNGFDFFKTLVLFIIYFLGGYLLYASLFAAIGSAVDNETDTQQFSMPLTIPILFAIYAAIYSAQNPDGPLAFWCSLIPFTSPIVMMVRLPFDVPAWQIVLSIVILVLSFIGTTWIAGKIYRTGILMYGKKVSWKELWRWVRYK